MSNKRPLRVLHIIDTLGGGGSERLIWDIVRLSDPRQVKHRVATIFSDGSLVPFVYGEPLRQLGAYGSASARDQSVRHNNPAVQASQVNASASDQSAGGLLRRLPPGLKKPLVSIVNSVASRWQSVRRLAITYFPSSFTIPWEFFRFRPDVIHTHGFYSFKYGLLFKVLFRRPTVHLVPCLFSQMYAQNTGWLVDYYRRFHNHVACFALHPGYRSELMSTGVPAEKLFDINGTLDLEALARAKAERERHRAELRARLGIPADAPVALSVGRLDPTKGHSYAIEALPLILKQHPNLHWVLLGEGAERAELESLIKAHGVEQHAHLAGFDPEPFNYYAAADVYLRTTTMEAENTSSQQAIAIGLPCVGFDTCRETDLIAKLGHGILVPNGDATALALATCKILSLPDRGQAMGALGIAYCNATLGMQKSVDDFLVIYTSLHQKKTPPQKHVAGLVADR
ncbi:MAG TPA: glycosyltransferase [Pyrinomonadaceae bacterium]|nr:glycosyltransferase [Pyrinomonadaceae bacterium]